MLKEGMDLKEGLRNYQFNIIEDVISDIVFEYIPFDENTRENVAKYLENKFKNISNKIIFEYHIKFNYSMRDCVVEVIIDNEKRLYDLMAYLRFVENMGKVNKC